MRGRALALSGAALLAGALSAAPPPTPVPGADAAIAARIESAWRAQQRWEGVAKNGSFEYDFELKTWSSSGRIKEHVERTTRVTARDGESRSEILAARKDGRDDLAAARAEERENDRKRGRSGGKTKEFPSPFDPKFRGEYAVGETPAGLLTFRPRRRLDGAIEGTAEFDGGGRPRRVVFTLARPPIFTRNLSFVISIDEKGNPVRVDSGGEISLIVWKRRFESTLMVRDVVAPAEKEEP